MSDSHRNNKAMSASYPLLSEPFHYSCITESGSYLIHTLNFYTGVAEGRKAREREREIKRLLQEMRENNRGRKNKDCTNGGVSVNLRAEGANTFLCTHFYNTPTYYDQSNVIL